MNDLLKLLTDTRQKLVMVSGQIDGVFVNRHFKRALANLDELTHLVVKTMNATKQDTNGADTEATTDAAEETPL